MQEGYRTLHRGTVRRKFIKRVDSTVQSQTLRPGLTRYRGNDKSEGDIAIYHLFYALPQWKIF